MQLDQPSPDGFGPKAHPSRTCDYWLGGRDNYESDRQVADRVEALYPHIRASVRANRAFVSRAVIHVAVHGGVDQFVDLGCGLPRRSSPAEVVRRVAPEARIVCVDRDEVVRAHAYAASVRPAAGRVAVLPGDVRDPDAVLADLRALGMIDFTRPVGLVLAAVLHFLTDEEGPHWIVDRIVAALPAGSFVVLTHGTQDFDPADVAKAAGVYNRVSAAPYVPRTFAEVREFFQGLDVLAPGVVQASHWRLVWPPGRADPHVGIYAGVGYKR
jgi:O-methyltransferase involved in polyketide biosynthesis